MNEEFCDGVKILLKRMESNPEEFKESNKWNHVLPKEAGGFSELAHALTTEEEQALKEGIRVIARGMFTEKVITTLLEDSDTGKLPSWNDPTHLYADHLERSRQAQNAYNPYGVSNSLIEQQRVVKELKDLGLFSVLKEKFKKL